MKILKILIKDYRYLFFKSFILAILLSLMSGGSLFVFLGIFNNIFKESGEGLIGVLLMKYFLLSSLTTFLLYGFEKVLLHFQDLFQMNLNKSLYQKIIDSPWIFLKQKSRGALSNHFQNSIPRVTLAAGAVIELISSGLFFVIFFSVGLYINAILTLTSGVFGGFLYFIATYLKRRSYRIGENLQKSYVMLSEHVEESFANMNLSKVLNARDQDMQEMQRVSVSIFDLSQQFAKARARLHSIHTLGGISTCLFIIYLGHAFFNIPFSNLAILLFIYFQLMRKLQQIQDQILKFCHYQPDLDNIENLLASIDEVKPDFRLCKPIDFQSSIRIQDVSFSYSKKENSILNNINLSFNVGEFTVISGPSGCGKSTLLDILCGLLKPDSGAVFIDEARTDIYDNSFWKKEIGLVSQEGFFSQKTIFENMKYASPSTSEKEVYEALRLANALSIVNGLPDKIHSFMGHRGCFLSGGEKQRISLARALIRKPKLLLLDEASSALDEESKDKLLDVLHTLKKDIAIVFVTHQKIKQKYIDRYYHLPNYSEHIQKTNLRKELSYL